MYSTLEVVRTIISTYSSGVKQNEKKINKIKRLLIRYDRQTSQLRVPVVLPGHTIAHKNIDNLLKNELYIYIP